MLPGEEVKTFSLRLLGLARKSSPHDPDLVDNPWLRVKFIESLPKEVKKELKNQLKKKKLETEEDVLWDRMVAMTEGIVETLNDDSGSERDCTVPTPVPVQRPTGTIPKTPKTSAKPLVDLSHQAPLPQMHVTQPCAYPAAGVPSYSQAVAYGVPQTGYYPPPAWEAPRKRRSKKGKQRSNDHTSSDRSSSSSEGRQYTRAYQAAPQAPKNKKQGPPYSSGGSPFKGRQGNQAQPQASQNLPRNSPTGNSSAPNSPSRNKNGTRTPYCEYCRKSGHYKRECRARPCCAYCGVVGHIRSQCFSRQNKCWNCKEDGHTITECPDRVQYNNEGQRIISCPRCRGQHYEIACPQRQGPGN